MTGLESAKRRLFAGDCTCVLCKGEEVYISTERGVKPLVAWRESGKDFRGFFAADKVVGRATAFLYVLLGVKGIYAHVLSKAGMQVLNERGILVEYGTLTENIINRQGNGICPFEACVLHENDENEAYAMIRRKMQEMQILL